MSKPIPLPCCTSPTLPPHAYRSECFAEDLAAVAPVQSLGADLPARWPGPAAWRLGWRRGWRRRAAVCAAALAAIGLASPAWADNIVSYTYSGVVDNDDAGRGWTHFSGQIAFDRTALDQIADPSSADYKIGQSPGGNWPNGFNVVFNTGESASFNHYVDILVSNNLGGMDQWGALAYDAGSTDSLGLTLSDFSQALFASDALPLPGGGLTLAMFSWSELKYESAGGLLSGHLTDLQCVAGCDAGGGGVPASTVPEPRSLVLVLAALAACGLLMRRQRRR